MKIWTAFGSEHSMNLVMIGRFKEACNADEAKRVIDTLTTYVITEEREGCMSDRFSDQLCDLLEKSKIWSLAPTELHQLAYDISIETRGKDVVVTTEEVEVSALLKILLEKGARIEIYSAHEYPDTEYGR